MEIVICFALIERFFTPTTVHLISMASSDHLIFGLDTNQKQSPR